MHSRNIISVISILVVFGVLGGLVGRMLPNRKQSPLDRSNEFGQSDAVPAISKYSDASPHKATPSTEVAKSKSEPSKQLLWSSLLSYIQPGTAGGPLACEVIRDLAKTDPLAALELARYWQLRGVRGGVLAALGGWSEVDPMTAWGFAKASKDRDVRSSLYALTGQMLQNGQYKEISDLVLAEPAGRERMMLLSNMAKKWGSANGEDFVDWMYKAPGLGDTERSSMLATYLSTIAKEDIDIAQAMASGGVQDGNRKSAIDAVVGVMVRNGDSIGALKWLNDTDSFEVSDLARAMIAIGLASDDMTSATELISKIPDGIIRDDAIARIAYNNLSSDPSLSFIYSQQMTGPSKLRNLAMIAEKWMAQDSEVALDYILNSSRLSEEEKKQLMDQLIPKS